MDMKTININDDLHKRLKSYCGIKGILLRPLIEKIINDALDEHIREEKLIQEMIKKGREMKNKPTIENL